MITRTPVLIPDGNSAVISECGRYRYLLTRRLGHGEKVATFIMLNPSTADAERDDATIRKVSALARRWGGGELRVVNLFAYRATHPGDLKRADDPVGPDNAAWLARTVGACRGPVVCAWGVHGAYLDQDLAVLRLLDGLRVARLALGVTKDGHPRHPLYVPSAAPLLPFAGRNG